MSTRQFIITTRGESVGVVLDPAPMTPRHARRHAASGGVRSMLELAAFANQIALITGDDVIVTEPRYFPDRVSSRGRQVRSYRALLHCRVVLTAQMSSGADRAHCQAMLAMLVDTRRRVREQLKRRRAAS